MLMEINPGVTVNTVLRKTENSLCIYTQAPGVVHALLISDDASRLGGTRELEDIQKLLSDALKTIAEIFKLQEEMMRRNANISASGGLSIDRTNRYLRAQDRRKR